MANNKQNKDEIRKLNNHIHLGGMLAELDPPKEGKTADGVPYISLKGAIQCHPEDVSYTAFFSAFIKATTTKGEHSKNYDRFKKWAKEAVPMTKDKENCTFVDMTGSLTSNNYVAADGQFKENFVYNINYVQNFTKYCFDLDIEGYISGIEDIEDENDSDNNKKRLGLVSKDFFNNALIFNKANSMNHIVAWPETIADFDDANYEQGRTVNISCSRAKMETNPVVKKGGFGRQPVTTGPSIMCWRIEGGDEALDEDDPKALTKAQIKTLTTAYAERNNEIIEAGYLGKKNNGATKKTGLGSKKSGTSEGFQEVEEDDDDMPF